MAITIVQSTGNTATAPNPTLAFTPRAGNYGLAFLVHAADAVPDLLTDNRGEIWQRVTGCNSSSDTLGAALYQCRVFASSQPHTLTFPATAASAFGVIELAGVAAITGKGLPSGVFIGEMNSTDFVAGVGTNAAGDLLIALVCSLGPATYTLVPGPFTALRALSGAGCSFALATEAVTAGPIYSIAEWTLPARAATIIAAVGIPHA